MSTATTNGPAKPALEFDFGVLPYDDGIPMETPRHRFQMNLLIESLDVRWADRDDFYVGGNMFVYFSPDQVRSHDFRGPDLFVVLDVTRRERKSWVVWQEGKGPDGQQGPARPAQRQPQQPGDECRVQGIDLGHHGL